jgi:hypothetical protein
VIADLGTNSVIAIIGQKSYRKKEEKKCLQTDRGEYLDDEKSVTLTF